MPRPEMKPTGSGSTTQAEMDAMQRNMPAIDLTSQESMMNYLMEKVEQIRERTGAQGQEGMGALEALLKSLPTGRRHQERLIPCMEIYRASLQKRRFKHYLQKKRMQNLDQL